MHLINKTATMKKTLVIFTVAIITLSFFAFVYEEKEVTIIDNTGHEYTATISVAKYCDIPEIGDRIEINKDTPDILNTGYLYNESNWLGKHQSRVFGLIKTEYISGKVTKLKL